VAHLIYGVASTINSANYVYFLALQKMLTLGHPDAPAVFTEQLLELHRGQGMDIYWRDSFQCPTEEEYKKMVIQSTLHLSLGYDLLTFSVQNEKIDIFFRNWRPFHARSPFNAAILGVS
jgi:Polyprenyl synthetase